MKRKRDELTLDMFEVPQVFEPGYGNWDFRLEVSHQVSETLKQAAEDRFAIAAEMSRLTGRDISKGMLDAYASPAREDHNLPLALVPVLEQVIASRALTDWLVGKRGGRAEYGADVLKAELGKLTLLKQQADHRIRQIKKLMSEQS